MAQIKEQKRLDRAAAFPPMWIMPADRGAAPGSAGKAAAGRPPQHRTGRTHFGGQPGRRHRAAHTGWKSGRRKQGRSRRNILQNAVGRKTTARTSRFETMCGLFSVYRAIPLFMPLFGGSLFPPFRAWRTESAPRFAGAAPRPSCGRHYIPGCPLRCGWGEAQSPGGHPASYRLV